MIFMPFLAAHECKCVSLFAPEKKQVRFVDIEAKSAIEPQTDILATNCFLFKDIFDLVLTRSNVNENQAHFKFPFNFLFVKRWHYDIDS